MFQVEQEQANPRVSERWIDIHFIHVAEYVTFVPHSSRELWL